VTWPPSCHGGKPRTPAISKDWDLALVEQKLAEHFGDVRAAAKELGVQIRDLRHLTWAKPNLLERAHDRMAEAIAKYESRFFTMLNSPNPRDQERAVDHLLSRWEMRDSPFAPASRERPRRPGRTFTPYRSKEYSWGWPKPQWVIDRELAAADDRVEVPSEEEAVSDDAASRPEPSEACPATPIAPDPKLAVLEANTAELETARYNAARIDARIRRRLIGYPVERCLWCRQRVIDGQPWLDVWGEPAASGESVRARFHRQCHVEWRAEQEAEARRFLGL
jgi:hypothetical protein